MPKLNVDLSTIHVRLVHASSLRVYACMDLNIEVISEKRQLNFPTWKDKVQGWKKECIKRQKKEKELAAF